MKKRLFTALVVLTGMLILSASTVWAAPPAPVAKTGQTWSGFIGDDGYYQMGVATPTPRFTDHGDGTVTDKLTGLMWTKDANLAGAINWYGALAIANNLSLGIDGCGTAYTDWRLPNINELLSLMNVNFSPYDPEPEHPFINVSQSTYYTSTHVTFNPTGSYSISFSTKFLSGVNKTDVLGYVWPVRGGN